MVGNYCRWLLLVLLMASCGISRKTERSDTAVSVQTGAELHQTAFQGSGIRLTDFVKKDMTIRFHWVKFDTDKKPDAEGNYPKMGEGSGEVELHEDEVLDMEQNDSTQVESGANLSHEAEAEEHSQSESEREETKMFGDIAWLCFSCVILILVVWIVRRK